jgi:predicted nucleic acid-binding protein
VLAADTSSLIAYLSGATGDDVEKLAAALDHNELVLPPVVITELLSDAKNRQSLAPQIIDCATLEILPGYWERAGTTRAILLAMKLSAKVPDALIAQSCIDHDVALITRDGDFRHFAKHCGLKLAVTA